MRIAIIVEGQTEKAFLPHLRKFLQSRLDQRMPTLDIVPENGRIPTGDKLKRKVEALLTDSKKPADAVIALTDIYTGNQEFRDAAEAKRKMIQWVGTNPSFFPHVAQYDFEAWLLPYWKSVCELAGSNRAIPSNQPETVDHGNPPAHRIAEAFRTGLYRKAYIKPRDANRILKDKDLTIAAQACPELKSFLNRILGLCGATLLS